jgi:predicted PhzF superfamily epimerase YddE/YHI9
MKAKVDTFEACKDRCKSDPTCLALENWSLDEGFVCRRFSEVTGVSEDPVKEKLIEIDIKKQ